jgi:DNA modification methylase
MVGDSRDLSFLKDNSIDLIITHPPYMNIIKYSDGKIPADLSNISSLPKFCDEIEIVAKELFRVLKPDKYCAILIGDTRKGKHFVPLAFNVMQRFLKAGFVLKEDIIKVQHNCTTTGRWRTKALQNKFYLIMHEHLFVFRKPVTGEDISRIKNSAAG